MHIAPRPTALPRLGTDDRTQDLTVAEMLALAALRLWAAPHRQPGRAHPPWRDAFDSAGLDEDDAEAFDTFMRLVVSHGLRQLDVRCPHCPGLGEDEVLLLDALRLLQAPRRLEAQLLLQEWLPMAALRAAMPFVTQLAGAMVGRKLILPPRGRDRAASVSVVHSACLH